jgi:RNA polymerase sigma-70 factor (ECF subfamily)
MANAAPVDAEVLRRAGTGDIDALGTLYDRHSDALLGIALRVLRDRTQAEDVVHDVFVRVGELARFYDPTRGSVLTWLAAATRNLSIDRLRQRQRRLRLAVELASAADGPYERETPFVDGSRVTAALSVLPQEQRTVIDAAYFEGLSFPEIAQREAIPLGTVKSRAARALASLRCVLSDDSDDEETLGPSRGGEGSESPAGAYVPADRQDGS